MNARERVLAGFAVFLGAGVLGYVLWGWYASAVEARQSQLEQLEKQLLEQKMELAKGRKASRQLSAWRSQSLPQDVGVAGTKYQNWLTSLVKDAGFEEALVDAGRSLPKSIPAPNNQREVVYRLLPFTIRGKGDLKQLTDFLYAFYQAPHLHQLQRFSIKPTAKRGELELTLNIDAVSLPTAKSTEELSTAEVQRLALTDIKAYHAAIDGRNMFSAYVPPPPPRPKRAAPPVRERPRPTPPPKPRFDSAKFAVISGIIEVGDRPEVWINERTTGKLHKFSEGDQVKIGLFEGTVRRIGTLDVVLQTPEGQRVFTLGETLHEGVDL